MKCLYHFPKEICGYMAEKDGIKHCSVSVCPYFNAIKFRARGTKTKRNPIIVKVNSKLLEIRILEAKFTKQLQRNPGSKVCMDTSKKLKKLYKSYGCRKGFAFKGSKIVFLSPSENIYKKGER
jgi:hypothetical protein